MRRNSACHAVRPGALVDRRRMQEPAHGSRITSAEDFRQRCAVVPLTDRLSHAVRRHDGLTARRNGRLNFVPSPCTFVS